MSNLSPRGYARMRAAIEKTDHPRFSAEPVSDYWQALHRVLSHLDETGEYYDRGPLPFVVQFVADVWWLSPEQVRRDLVRLRKSQVI